jgi:hypothetical protein
LKIIQNELAIYIRLFTSRNAPKINPLLNFPGCFLYIILEAQLKKKNSLLPIVYVEEEAKF